MFNSAPSNRRPGFRDSTRRTPASARLPMAVASMLATVLAVVLAVVVPLALPIAAHAVPPSTAPDGDLNQDGAVTTADLQCLILLFGRHQSPADCTSDAECPDGERCRPAWNGESACMPPCLAAAVEVVDSGQCTEPGADTAVCSGLTPRPLADLNCDGLVTNVDIQFHTFLLLGATGGPGTADIDSDGRLNFCDDDSDGDGTPDTSDCLVLDPTSFPGAPEVCDGQDNDCDGATDTADSQSVVLDACDIQEGACGGAQRTADLCQSGAWIPCGAAQYGGNPDWQATETRCDTIDNDCDGLTDADDPDGLAAGCCNTDANCGTGFAAPPACDSAATCQGTRGVPTCVDGACAPTAFPDDSGCDTDTVALDCGVLGTVMCNGRVNQVAPICPTVCTDDGECPDGAWCHDGACEVLFPDGFECTSNPECESGHCQNGFCCATGDCCFEPDDCTTWGHAPTCDSPEVCQGTRADATCVDSQCGETVVDDDSGCGAEAGQGCGLLADLACDGTEDQPIAICPFACTGDSQCDPDAFCDGGICAPRFDDGADCTSDAQCLSDHCTAGICCTGTDCCSAPTDCPAEYTTGPTCTDPVLCQGNRTEAACVGFVCEAAPISDDSACTAALGTVACADGGTGACSGAPDQGPACDDACLDDDGCAANQHCEPPACVSDLPNGATCDEGSDCVSGHCQNGYCCASGDCCAVAADCDGYGSASTCIFEAACLGTAEIAACQFNRCTTTQVTDSSGCGPDIVADGCGGYADIRCTGEAAQAPPPCTFSCGSDSDCDDTHYCLGSACQPKKADGAVCGDDRFCASGHCGNGFCCSGGDCCSTAANCPAEYATAAQCTEPSLCQGERGDAACVDNVCGTAATPDDSACTSGQVADDCGPFPTVTCAGGTDQPVASCATTCTDNGDCDANAYCQDGSCVIDALDGEACSADGDCASGHCQNGFCCSGGDCCAQVTDCAKAPWFVAVSCTDVAGCQGSRNDPSCENFTCGTQLVDDDSACTAQTVADDCGLFAADLTCTGGADQSGPTGSCPSTCASDDDCADGAWCDPDIEECLAVRPNGDDCSQDSACASGHCEGDICCDSGECCQSVDDCEAPSVATCTDASSCQGTLSSTVCLDNQCGQVVTDDDSGCGPLTEANECGCYRAVTCDGSSDQSAPTCPTSCTDDAECDDSCHCDGTCEADLPAGATCDEDSDCAGGSCDDLPSGGSVCCDAENCCNTVADCPIDMFGPSTCQDAATCQGQRKEAICQNNACVQLFIDDDRDCDEETVADECGLYLPAVCDGTLDQAGAPACATTCSSDADCTDGLFCTGEEVCNGGSCVAGTPPVLDDGIACTIDTCDEATDTIVHSPDDALCNDGLFCNGGETCQAGGCATTTPAPVLDDGVPCTVDTCDEANDVVLNTPDHESCSDGVFCNGAEQCDPGAGCGPGTPPVVDDNVGCTIDSCDETNDVVLHLPDDGQCDDGLVCTSGFCNQFLGCLAALTEGFCVIEGQCLLSGAVNPDADCERCDPDTSQISWTARAAQPEVCNGIDDNCDLNVDNQVSGDPLVVTCQNSCGTVGTASCVLGTVVGCSVSDPPELCDDTVDNDCDGITDETDCYVDKPTLDDVFLRGNTTLGTATGLFTALGDGRYETQVVALRQPNTTGEFTVSSQAVSSPPASFSVDALPPAFLEMVIARDVLYADRANTRFVFQVKDELDRAPTIGTAVSLTLSGLPGGSQTLGCTTDASGRCSIDWTAPAGLFDSGGQVLVSASTATAAPLLRTITVVPKVATLTLAAPGCGAILPTAPQFPGGTLEVPVIINTAGQTLASYDMAVDFDPGALEVLSVVRGDCTALGFPTSNAAGDANTTGTLQFNAAAAGGACSNGSAVHIATINFRLAADITPGDGTLVTVRSISAFDDSLAPILGQTSCLVGDSDGPGTTGTISTEAVTVSGILARTPVSHLSYRQLLDGANDTTDIIVTGVRTDLSLVELADDPGTSYTNPSPEVVGVSNSGVVTAKSQSGTALLTVTHAGVSSSARLRVRVPRVADAELTISDAQLNAIDGAGGLLQAATVRATVDWEEDGEVVFTEDITDRLTWTPSFDVQWSPATRTVTTTTLGQRTLIARGGGGFTVGEVTFQGQPTASVQCTGLVLQPACEVVVDRLDPEPTNVALGRTRAEVVVNAFMDTYLQTCQLEVYAAFNDGRTMRITGKPGLSVTSDDPLVFSSSTGGLLTAQGDGTATASASWSPDGSSICTGETDVLVKLPKAVEITATPVSSDIAISAADPAATVKGLPSSQQLQVLVHFADGSSIDFTDHASTVYDADVLDPSGVINCTDGLVTPTGAGPGEANVRVSVGQYPTLPPAEPFILVVEATGLTTDLYEPFTPTPPRVADHRFETIEGSGTWQDAIWEILLDFSDGSQVNVTSDAAATIAAYEPGTNTPNAAVLALSKTPATVTPTAAGTVDVVLSAYGFETRIAAVEVVNEPIGIAALVPQLPSGNTTLSAIKDGSPVTLTTWTVMADGTRRRLWGAREVPGLLEYVSTVPTAATINNSGDAVARGNAATVFSVDVQDAVDTGGAFDPPAELAVDVNLLPDVGDIDLGDTVGLAHKDRSAGETFTMVARVNTGELALGAFDVQVDFDPTVITPVGVTVGADVGDAVFNANIDSQPGRVLFNGTLPVQGSARKGTGIRIATLEFEALKPSGATVTSISGTVVEVAALDGEQDIGPATPRGFVAGAGDLDPDCSGEVFGDVDGDCSVSAEDLMRIGGILAGRRAPESAADLDGDGQVTARDAALLAQLL